MVYRVADGQLRAYFMQTGGSVLYAPDGADIILAGDGNSIYFYSAASVSFERALEGHTAAVVSLSISRDGKYLLSGSSDNTIRLWRVSDGQTIKRYDQETAGVRTVALSPDGKYFAYGRSDGAVVLARMPLVLDPPQRSGGQLRLQWNNPGGFYQLEEQAGGTSYVWRSVDSPSTNTILSLNLTSPAAFYRVRSLPNP